MKFILINSLKYQSIHTNVLISTNHKKENNLSGLHYIAIWSYNYISNEFTQRAIEIFHEPMLAVPLI